jgi:hypothetical protein
MNIYIGPYIKMQVAGLGQVYVPPEGTIGAIDLSPLDKTYKNRGLFLTDRNLPLDYSLFSRKSGSHEAKIIETLLNGDPLVEEMTGPLMPTARRFRIHLGPLTLLNIGYSLNNRVKTIVRKNLWSTLKEEGPIRAGQSLDFYSQSLGVDAGVLKGRELKDLELVPHGTSYSVDFTGYSDGTALTSGGWVDDGLSQKIPVYNSDPFVGGKCSNLDAFGNFVGQDASCVLRYPSAFSGPDMYVQASNSNYGLISSSVGFLARVANDSSTYYLGTMSYGCNGSNVTQISLNNNGVEIWKRTGGSYTHIGTPTSTSSQRYGRCRAEGSTISSYYDYTTLDVSVTDTSITSGNNMGLWQVAPAGSNSRMKDWYAEDIVPPGHPAMRRILENRRNNSWNSRFRPTEIGRQGVEIY